MCPEAREGGGLPRGHVEHIHRLVTVIENRVKQREDEQRWRELDQLITKVNRYSSVELEELDRMPLKNKVKRDDLGLALCRFFIRKSFPAIPADGILS